MAEFIDAILNKGVVKRTEIDTPMHEAFPSDVQSDVSESVELTQNILGEGDTRAMEEKIELATTNLQDIIIKISQHKVQLLHIKIEKRSDFIASILEDEISLGSEILETFDEIKKFKIIDLEDCKAMLKIVEEIFGSFFTYIKAYRKCIFLIEILHKRAEKQKICNISTSIEKLSDSFSTFKERLVLYSAILESCTKIYEQRKSLNENHLEIIYEAFYNMIDFLITAIEKAELAYSGIKSVMFDLINFE